MKYMYEDPCHVVIELENRQCKVLKTLRELGIKKFKIADIRGLKGGITRHLVKLPVESTEKIPERPATAKGKLRGGKTLLWMESEGCDVCNTILSHGSFLVSGTSMKNYTFIYDFIVPNFDAYLGIISALESVNLKVKVLRLTKVRPKGKILTEKQERILWLALEAGLFDYPKRIDMVEFSRKLGISPSTLSEVVRRGVRRLLENYFESL